jgi:hypothetical protein
MIFRTLTTNERAESCGFTHVGVVTADDLTQTTVTTAQLITFTTGIVAGDQVVRVGWYLKLPFQNTLVGADNATTASVGDTAAVGTHLAPAVVNVNGTEIIWRAGNTAVLYTAGDKLTANFIPTTGSALSALNRGELHIYFALSRLKAISDAIGAASPLKP